VGKGLSNQELRIKKSEDDEGRREDERIALHGVLYCETRRREESM
jgi:hypothetical protein